MREIKFRAWHTIWKKMAYLDNIWDNSWYATPSSQKNENGMVSCEEVFPNKNSSELTRGLYHKQIILMQFTGLKDKKGKDIYEGDILEFEPEEWGNKNNNRFVVEWSDEEACFFGNGTISDWGEWCEIIGNIYENPELLEARK